VLAVLATEFRIHLRDPVTILLMVVLPVVVYPALALVGGRVVERAEAAAKAESLTVAVDSSVDLPENLLRSLAPPGESAVRDGLALAAATLTGEGADLYYDSRDSRGTEAADRLATAVRAHVEATRGRVERRDLVPPERRARERLAQFLPGLLLFLVLTGGLYTALDVVTGERERGTLETLLSTAAERRQVVYGKFLVVLAFCAAPTAAALVSGWICSRWLHFVSLPFATVLTVLGLCLPLCALLAGALVAVASWVPDFKAGQLWSLPLLLVPFALGGASALPGVTLTWATALLPLANLTIAIRDVVAHGVESGPLVLALTVSTAASAATMRWSVRLLGREDTVLGNVGAAARRLRGDFRADAVLLYTVAVLGMWLLALPMQAVDLVWGMVGTQLAVLAPLAFAAPFLLGLPIKDTLGIRRPAGADLLRALLLGLALPGVGLAIGEIQRPFVAAPAALDGLLEPPLLVALLAFAVLPGLCEELLFRGAMLGLFRSRGSAPASVAFTALAFGLFHVDVARLLPTAVLGVLLGVLAVRTRSVVPGICAHLINNSVLLTLAHFQLDLWEPLLVGALSAVAAVALVARSGASAPAAGRSAVGGADL
jgi:ABC-type Na+ efflux pump permease subunit/membrane protease YdiL (CAAX protease family)